MAVIVNYNAAKLRKLMQSLPDEAVRILHDGTNYGVHQEFGIRHWRSGNMVPAHPFMTPAIEGVRPEFNAGWKQVIEQQVMDADRFVETVARHAQSLARQYAPYKTGYLKNSIDVHKPSEMAEMLR